MYHFEEECSILGTRPLYVLRESGTVFYEFHRTLRRGIESAELIMLQF